MKKLTSSSILGVALLIATTPCTRSAPEQLGRVIESISDREIMFEDGGTVHIRGEVKVQKKGYELSLADVRPGWSVVPSGDTVSGDGVTLKVVAIPLVRTFPAYSGMRDTVGVARAELGLLPAVKALEGVDAQQAIEAITAAALRASGRFILVDLASRDEVLNEQDFSRTGYANAGVAPKDGRLIPARYLVKAAVLDFDYATRSGNGVGLFGVQVAKNKARSRLTMEIRLVDAASGTVKASARTTKSFGADATQVRVNVAETAGSLVPFSGRDGLKDLERAAASGLSIAHNGFVQSPIGELFALAINDLVEKLIAAVPAQDWRSVIVNVIDETRVVVRGGSDAGLASGAVLDVLKRSDDLIDPDTGESLGSLTVPLGRVVVEEVQPKLSIARVQSGVDIARGDICVLRWEHR